MFFSWFSLHKNKIARALDSAFRGLSRGLAAKTFVEILGRIFHFNSSPAATITSIPVTLAASCTSYTGTRWWTLDNYNDEEIRSFIASNRACFFHSARYLDALFRGAARAEVVTNCLVLIGQLMDYDLLLPAGVAGFITLCLATWTSYNRGVTRSRYAEALLPIYETDITANATFTEHKALLH